MSARAMHNPVILSKILTNLNEEKTILDQLRLRLVSKAFNSSILSLIRRNHRKVTISEDRRPKDQNAEEEKADTFYVNQQLVSLDTAPAFFEFLNVVAGIQIRSLIFDECSEPNDDVHNAVMLDLIECKNHPIKEFIRGRNVCTIGCFPCYWVARKCKSYGPMQCYFPLKTRKHFEKLQVDEIWLNEVAKSCTAQQTGAAFEAAIERRISSLITCDHLELILSDCYFNSRNLFFSRRLIDEMTNAWKVKRVTVTFITLYTEGINNTDTFGSGPKYPLEPFGFHQLPESVPDSRCSFEQVEINLQRAFRFGYDFVSQPSIHSPDTGLENLIAMVQKVFPTRKIYISLPHNCFRGSFDQVFSNFLRFSWCQEQEFLFRGTEMFVRFLMLEETIEKADFKNLRQAINQYKFFVDVKPCTETVLREFEKWQIPHRSIKSEPAMTFFDQDNRRQIHCEVLMNSVV